MKTVFLIGFIGLAATAIVGCKKNSPDLITPSATNLVVRFADTSAPNPLVDIFLDQYTDADGPIDPTTHHNENSAIVKAYNSIIDTTIKRRIYFNLNKTYVNTGFYNDGYWDKPNCEFVGSMPSYAADAKSLVGGTVVKGGMLFFANNINVHNIGFDVGKNVCDEYGLPNGRDVLGLCINPGQIKTTQRHNIIGYNIRTLALPNSFSHAILLEFCNGAYLNNTYTMYGYHGSVIKSENVTWENLYNYGQGADGLVIKSDSYAHCNNVIVNNVSNDKAPQGVIGYAVVNTVYGVIINPYGAPMDNVDISNITTNANNIGIEALGAYQATNIHFENFSSTYCLTAISLDVTGNNWIFDNVTANNGNYGLILTQAMDVHMNSLVTENVSSGVNVSNGNLILKYYAPHNAYRAFNISGAGNVYIGDYFPKNVAARNNTLKVDLPIKLWH